MEDGEDKTTAQAYFLTSDVSLERTSQLSDDKTISLVGGERKTQTTASATIGILVVIGVYSFNFGTQHWEEWTSHSESCIKSAQGQTQTKAEPFYCARLVVESKARHRNAFNHTDTNRNRHNVQSRKRQDSLARCWEAHEKSIKIRSTSMRQ